MIFPCLVLGQSKINSLPASSKNETPNSASFSPDGRYVVAGVYGAARLWKVSTGDYKDYKVKLKNTACKYLKK